MQSQSLAKGTADEIEPPEQEESQWESRMLRGYQRTMPLQQVVEAIWSGNAIIRMDGSAANSHGTYSFVILTDVDNEDQTIAVKCGGNLPNLAEY
jgi:hypothetical protein